MSSRSSPTLQRGARKVAKQAPAATVSESSGDSQAAVPAAASANGNDLEARIRVRAYEHYEQRGSQEGHELDDWLQAEREVLATHSRTMPEL